jgi:hypothetical protein
VHLVKWLGKDALTPLAVDGKGGKAELLEKVALWVAAHGRNVTQPGESSIAIISSSLSAGLTATYQ